MLASFRSLTYLFARSIVMERTQLQFHARSLTSLLDSSAVISLGTQRTKEVRQLYIDHLGLPSNTSKKFY
jgi:hypothetical protein